MEVSNTDEVEDAKVELTSASLDTLESVLDSLKIDLELEAINIRM
jgi:hypothetical protein